MAWILATRAAYRSGVKGGNTWASQCIEYSVGFPMWTPPSICDHIVDQDLGLIIFHRVRSRRRLFEEYEDELHESEGVLAIGRPQMSGSLLHAQGMELPGRHRFMDAVRQAEKLPPGLAPEST